MDLSFSMSVAEFAEIVSILLTEHDEPAVPMSMMDHLEAKRDAEIARRKAG